MKTPVIDYRRLRLSNINSPEFSHLKLLLLSWVFYFGFYFLTENLIPAERCHVIHCGLDDLIPFREEFLLAYTFWYLLIFGSLLYYLLYDIDCFRRLQTYIFITQLVAMTIYILWPSRQDLRPAVFPRDNVLTHIIAFIYSFDTPTGVCPSLHVAYSLGLLSVWLRDKNAPRLWKAFMVVIVILIALSTMFIKQHSALDVLAALPLGILAEAIVQRDWWKARLGKKG